ncbi:MAG: hypothetical protein Kow002_14020 [Anaerolineales bacterium]
MPEPEEKQKGGSLFQRTWRLVTKPSSALTDIGDQRSAQLAASFFFALLVLLMFPTVIRALRTTLRDSLASGLGIPIAATLAAYILAKTPWYRLAIFLFAVSYSASGYIAMINQGSQGSQANVSLQVFLYVPVSLIIASTFLSWPAVFLLTGLNVGALVMVTSYFGVPVPDGFGAIAGVTTVTGVVLILLTNFRNNTEQIRLAELQAVNRELDSLSRDLEQRVSARTQELVQANQRAVRRSEQFMAIAEIARSTTDIQDLNTLLTSVTQLISERLGYYHVGIFMNDANNTYTILRAANSAGGEQMLKRGHKLRIGEEGIVGYAVKSGQPRIALDVGADAVYFDNPDLPNTRSEMAVPLQVGANIIGALDIQSTEPNAFSAEDMPVFRTLADQVAVAIQNARLLIQSQETLRELEEAYAEQTGQIWKKFKELHAVHGYQFDGIEPAPIRQNAKKQQGSDTDAAIFPMRLRGQTIAKLKLKAGNKNRQWTREEVTLINAALDRAALALENARLLEDAQRRAAREQNISDISAKITASVDTEAVLKTAVQELGRQIEDAKILIELNPEPEQADS